MRRVIVQTDRALNEMLEVCEKVGKSSTDAEFVPMRRHSGKPEMIGWNFAAHLGREYFSWYVPLGHYESALDGLKNYPVEKFFARTRKFFQSRKQVHVCHSAGTESECLKWYGTELGPFRDTMIESWMYDENKLYPYKLKMVTPIVLGRKALEIKDVVASVRGVKVADLKGSEKADLRPVPVRKAALYGTDDAINTLQLHEWFEPEMEQQGLLPAYHRIELPMSKILRDMAMTGVPIDIEGCKKQLDLVDRRIEWLESEVYKVAGEPFNIRSRPQLGRILFEKLGYPEMQIPDPSDPTGQKTMPYRTPTGAYKTSDDVMNWLADHGYPVARLLQSHGDLEKVRGTYLNPWIEESIDGLYHPAIWQCGTVTGRGSGDLQQVPRPDKDFDDAWERIGDRKAKIEERMICLRKVIAVPEEDPKDWLVVSDYNQLELRLLAHFSLDSTLVGGYKNGEDMHQGTADEIVACGAKSFSRQDAKPINFGLVYGLVLSTFIEMFGEEIGRKVFEALMRRFGGMMVYKDATIHQAHLDEFIRTIAWRKRRLPEINFDHFATRSFAEREAFNALIQGSAADVMKMAHIMVARKLPDIPQILNVHDESMMRLKGWTKKQALEIAKEVKKIFEEVGRMLDLAVPLVAEPKVGKNWLECK